MNKFIIFFVFVYISMIVNEFPPFTKSNMYSHFPEKTTLFYITDSHNKILPFKKHYDYSIFNIAHNYSSIENKKSKSSEDLLKDKIDSYAKNTFPITNTYLHIVELSLVECKKFQKKIIQSSGQENIQ